MNYNELKEHAETCQMAADELAHGYSDYLTKSSILARFQSHCESNLFFVYSTAPEVILHVESIDFLLKHKEKFKRKISLKELLRFDFIINSNKLETFEEFIDLLKK